MTTSPLRLLCLSAVLSVLAAASESQAQIDNGESHYSAFALQTGTALAEAGKNFQFALAANRDLFAIKQSDTGTQSTEVHVISAASNYQSFVVHTGTPLKESGSDFAFLVSGANDLYAVKQSGTASETTEVFVLSAKSQYTEIALHTATALHETGSNFEFQLAPNDDLFAIKKSDTGSNSTEVHVLTAESGYQQFSVQTGTPLKETGSGSTFLLARNRDIVVLNKLKTESNMTEVQVLSATDNYQTLSTNGATALHETDSAFAFSLAYNRDIFAIKKRDTGSESTEVHVLQY
jgi:uncharacterized protein YegJ (DUF2314 family)